MSAAHAGDGDGDDVSMAGDGEKDPGDGQDGQGSGGDSGGDGDNVKSDAGSGPALPPESSFACSGLAPIADDVAARTCLDFSDDASGKFAPEGGDWSVADGAYVGTGPLEPVNCAGTGSNITASLLKGVKAADVRVHAQLTGVNRADKVIVLRARDAENRIELNFRSAFEDEGVSHAGDLVVQELVDCTSSFKVMPDVVAIPHDEHDAIDVDVELRGDTLRVSVDGKEVFNDAVTVSVAEGGVGVGVILGGVTRFDDFVVETLK
jgi:hypothetical protein